MTRLGLTFLLSAWSVSLVAADDMEALFVRRIELLFKAKCLACHGDDPAKLKGGFDMRTLKGVLQGGESNSPSVFPGNAEESPLYLAVTREHEDDWQPMPPKENDKLTPEQIGYIKQWINAGVPWPDEARRAAILKTEDKWSAADGIQVKVSGALSDDWANRRYKPESLWAYAPIKHTSQPNAIDALITAHWPKDTKPAPRADARTLIRRMTYDLTGLPPTPEEVAAFESASNLDSPSAIRDLINRLLDSPHYGEHWARHWLDVVRYADTSGFSNDYERGSAWRYRDYVVRAFNSDKPYDMFIKEQLAGDEIDPSNPEMLVACGFLRMGPWELTGMEVPKIARQRFLDDVTNSVGEVFLAHSLQCARCHDHKFDPIPTRDYYSMQACFATTQLAEREAAFLPGENVQGFEEKKYLDLRREEFTATLKRIDTKLLQAADQWFAQKKLDPAAWHKAVEQMRAFVKNGGKNKKRADYTSVFEGARMALQKQGVAEDQFPPKQVGFSTEEFGMERIARKGLERLRWEYDRYQPVAFSVYSGRTPDVKSVLAPQRMPPDRMTAGDLEQVAVLAGGDPFSPTQPVTPAALSAASFISSIEFKIAEEMQGRRTALAGWITNPQNPLTARVMMNRVWLWHFGQAIAGNPNNFGSTGKKPTNPELLDWLAATFMEKGWSLKAMHRLILSSEAYQRSAGGEADSANYAAFKPRRLTAEELRDSMLAISGELNPQLGGIPARPEINLEAALQPRQVMGTFATAWQPNPLPVQRHRRSLYTLKVRGLRDPFMEVFNEPAPDFSCEARDASNVTPQVFSLFNGKPAYDRALAFGHRVLQETHGDDEALARCFQRAYGRVPTADETKACLAHWLAMQAKHRTLQLDPPKPPLEVKREAVEENTGEKFSFMERLYANADFIPDLRPSDLDVRTRALAEVCLVLFNADEFVFVY